MATPPTLVSYAAAAPFNSTTSPKTVSVTAQAGDLLVAIGVAENDNTVLATPTGGTSITWTLQESLAASQFAPFSLWTAPITSGQTFNASLARTSGAGETGFGVYVFRSHGGVGAHGHASNAAGAPTLSLTTTGANSSIVIVSTDWNTVAGANTWNTVNGTAATEDQDSTGNSRYYLGHHGDAGAAGAKSVGMSAPTGQKYQIGAIEILGTTPAAGVQPSAGFFAGVI